MRMGQAYAVYVVFNLVAWNVRQENPFETGVVLGVSYLVVALPAGAVV